MQALLTMRSRSRSSWVPVILAALLMLHASIWCVEGRRHGSSIKIPARNTRRLSNVTRRAAGLHVESSLSHSDIQDSWVVEVLYRDAVPSSPLFRPLQAPEEAFGELVRRDEARVTALVQQYYGNARKMSGGAGANRHISSNVGTVVSGASLGTGEYLIQLGIGTPAQLHSFIVDTGSDLTWLQSLPCQKCFPQNAPLFDPAASSSFHTPACTSRLCTSLVGPHPCFNSQCQFGVEFADGSFTSGVVGLDDFMFGIGTAADKFKVSNLSFLCSQYTDGSQWPRAVAGVLGLGRGSISLPSQMNAKRLSFCLPPRTERTAMSRGFLALGSNSSSNLLNMPANAIQVALQSNPKEKSWYYVPLTGISVAGTRLPIPPSNFALNPVDRLGGTILDAGTTITRLAGTAYAVLRDAFQANTKQHLPSVPRPAFDTVFDTCYNLTGLSSTELAHVIPSVSLHFEGGASLDLSRENVLLTPGNASANGYDRVGCLAFAGAIADFTILGNAQLQGYLVSIDTAASTVFLAPNQC